MPALPPPPPAPAPPPPPPAPEVRYMPAPEAPAPPPPPPPPPVSAGEKVAKIQSAASARVKGQAGKGAEQLKAPMRQTPAQRLRVPTSGIGAGSPLNVPSSQG